MLLAKEVNRLKKKILTLSAVVEESVRKSVDAVVQCDVELAHEVIGDDTRIDDMEVEIEEDCLKVLALHQPVAIDLRYIVTVLKINNDLERIGDLSEDIAKGAIYFSGHPAAQIPAQLATMMKKTPKMLRMSLDALVNTDGDLAREVLELDDEIDSLHRQMFDAAKLRIQADVGSIEGSLRLLTVSRKLERIADLATNIAEDVIYMIDGKIVRHKEAWTPGDRSDG